jgi:uncharacterized protein (TIGR03083 family)
MIRRIMPDGLPPPLDTASLFPELDGKLLELLESLTPDEWLLQTVVPKWNVKQVAAHLLDTALRRLSLDRDGERPPHAPIRSDRDLADFVNDMNARGVEVYGRLSPAVLISLMRVAARELHQHFASLDPMAPAAFSVSWAGEAHSLNWFDTARELTERWHHQQQIRLAVNRPGIMTPRLYGPVLACFMRALPHAYRDLTARVGDVVEVRIAGDCGGAWFTRKEEDGWSLAEGVDRSRIVSTTTIPQEIAWRIFTKGLPLAAARPQISIEGDERLGRGVLSMLAIVS